MRSFYFNPRSREGSDIQASSRKLHVSYFNPRSREGSDYQERPNCIVSWEFQSTLPRRERLNYGGGGGNLNQFQSTLPRRERRVDKHGNPHGVEFQSTLPRRERPYTGKTSNAVKQFQSTLPRRERQGRMNKALLREDISIHAPAKGATGQDPAGADRQADFNPRSREGSDRRYPACTGAARNFNPRSREGSDLHRSFVPHMQQAFQSTLPRRERPQPRQW